MYILVDYDNVDIPLRKNGVKNVLERIASTLCQHVPNLPQRFEFRLYGGWYDQTTMTRKAQDISAQLTRDFPNVFIPFPTYQTKISLVLQAELARALLVDPSNVLLHTFRERARPSGICAMLLSGCLRPDCGLRHIKTLVEKGKCPEPGCVIKLENVLIKREQKLVDVMLACDLLHLVETRPSEFVVIVTSDQDLWPAIRQVFEKTTLVIHIHTKRQQTPLYYSRSIGTRYTELML